MELNVRTYVHDRVGVPGVWFYSLDANQWLAVKVARRFFHLPYEHATMTATRAPNGWIRYESARCSGGKEQRACTFEYAPGADLPAAAPGSLEFFLIERYRLYSKAPAGLRRGSVFHPPYPLCRANVTAGGDELLTLNGFPPAGRPPDHTILSRGVDVNIFALERI